MPQNIGYDVAILAGGLGTRLKSRTGRLPKPMMPIAGKPVLEHLIEMCRTYGFVKIVLLVHHEHETISDHFGDGSSFGVSIGYNVEHEPRGTGGALQDVAPLMAEKFFVLYGDTYADVDMRRMWEWHQTRASAAALFLHPNDHPADSDLIELQGDTILSIYPHPHEGALVRNLVNAGLYILTKSAVSAVLPNTGRWDFAQDTLPLMLKAGVVVSGYVSPEYIKDMGTPDRLDKVTQHVQAGLAERLSSRCSRQAVFLDRDGTLNVEVGHLRHPGQLKLIPGTGPAIRALNQEGYLAIAITNQPVIARGEVDEAGLDAIHAALDDQLGREGAYLDRLYFCPHHPDGGYSGEVADLKIRCECRKPDTGLIDRAVSELDVGREKSWFVGDSTADLVAGKRAGLRTILVETGHGGRDRKYNVKPDYTMPDLAHAVDWILSGHPKTSLQLQTVFEKHHDARLVLVGGPTRAGRLMVAQVLAEIYRDGGRMAHVVSLDGWLKHKARRREGAGVVERFDLVDLKSLLMPFTSKGIAFNLPDYGYEPNSRTRIEYGKVEIKPDDVIIVEGAIDLLEPDLLACASTTIHVDIDEPERFRNYRDRGLSEPIIEQIVGSRAVDESPMKARAAKRAAYRIARKYVA